MQFVLLSKVAMKHVLLSIEIFLFVWSLSVNPSGKTDASLATIPF
jgi:hypothetical protein